jgi:hypothetical protein
MGRACKLLQVRIELMLIVRMAQQRYDWRESPCHASVTCHLQAHLSTAFWGCRWLVASDRGTAPGLLADAAADEAAAASLKWRLPGWQRLLWA